jgi:hypothetical protein
MQAQRGVVTVGLRNTLKVESTLMVEPWTTEYILRPGQRFEIRAEGDLSLPLEIELTEEGVTFCSFDSQGAVVTVLSEGAEVAPKRTPM